jgi:hypothetical protein
MTQYEKDRIKAQQWAEACWPINGELSRRVHHELMRQAFMQGYERRLQEDRVRNRMKSTKPTL